MATKKQQDENIISIIEQNIRQLDADIISAYKAYIEHLQRVKEYYENYKKELTTQVNLDVEEVLK